MTVGASVASVALPRAARADATDRATPEWEMPLSQMQATRATGLTHEGLERNHLELFRAQARAYVDFRRSRLNAKEKLFWAAECLEQSTPNVFCRYVSEDGVYRRRAPASAGKAATSRADAYRVAEALEKGRLEGLEGVAEGSFHKAFAMFPSLERLSAAYGRATDGGCLPSALLTAFAQKHEQFFPDVGMRDRAIALFERSSACGDDESAQKARFRASLLHIWAGRCHAAEPHLLRLAAHPEGDFASRALYWRAHCAQEAGDKLQARVLRTRLLKDHPLSFHGLLLSQADAAPEFRHLLDAGEPAARFRTERAPDLNALVRGAELLLEVEAPDLARQLLDDLLAEGEGRLEAPFRAYAAALYGRTGDRIGQFRTLAGVFREDPRFINRATLEMFYPLRRFEAIRPQGGKVDPYLLAALIRQESGFNEHARSSVGALGLMQLMPATARTMQRRISSRQILQPETNVRLGATYYHGLLRRFDYDAELALAAYNAGPERVDEWRRRYPVDNRMVFFDLIPFKETRDYVALISRNYYWYLSLYDGERDLKLKDTKGRLPASVASAQPLVFTLFRR